MLSILGEKDLGLDMQFWETQSNVNYLSKMLMYSMQYMMQCKVQSWLFKNESATYSDLDWEIWEGMSGILG